MYIRSTTFDFLKDLKKNNNREWFQENKDRYEDAHQNVKDFVEAMIMRLSDLDPHINTEIKASKCLFRIYRDVRFSKNKDPYKNWLAAGISVDGRKLDGPEYYIHIEPTQCFIATGYWRPNKQHLDAIRQEIDYNGPALIKALNKGGWNSDNLDREDKLIRPPAGYAADHENIDLIKLKSFILVEHIPEEKMVKSDALETIIKFCEKALPFKNYIHQAIEID